MITREIPETFLSTQNINLTRLCEVLFLMLSRTTVGPEAELFNTVLSLRSTGLLIFHSFFLDTPHILKFTHAAELEKVDRRTIVSPVLGIMLSLTEGFVGSDFTGGLSSVPVIRHFASLPGISPEAFEFFLGSTFDLSLFTSCTPTQISRVTQILTEIVTQIKEHQSKQASELAEVAEEDLCPICYAERMTTRFEPCNHR